MPQNKSFSNNGLLGSRHGFAKRKIESSNELIQKFGNND
jgi:hypothetical protein